MNLPVEVWAIIEDVKKLFKDCKDWSGCYYDLLVNFSDLIYLRLKKYYINENNLCLAKSVIMNELFYSILPFRVWNHLFLCERSNIPHGCAIIV